MAGGIAFAGQAAGMGVAIVFAFLTVMSLLMVAMRSVDEFAGKTASRSKSDGVPVQTPAPTSPTPSPGKRIPEWAIAAAVVYLESEQEREEHKASVWTSRRFARPTVDSGGRQ